MDVKLEENGDQFKAAYNRLKPVNCGGVLVHEEIQHSAEVVKVVPDALQFRGLMEAVFEETVARNTLTQVIYW